MVIGWLPITLVVLSTGILLAVIIYYIHRCCHQPKHHHHHRTEFIERADSLQTGIIRLQHMTTLHHHLNQDQNKKRPNYQIFRRGVSSKPLFNWYDNPSLVTDAVENGWSRFAFTTYTSSPSIRSARSLLGVCGTGDQTIDTQVDISWEVCQGSADFMQKIRLNSGLKKINSTNYDSSVAAISVIKTALPLPGPLLGNSSSFPQEAYFEITVLSCGGEDDYEFVKEGKVEGEKIKLIPEGLNAKANSESLIHVSSSSSTNGFGQGNNSKVEELKIIKEDEKGGNEEGVVMLSVGLTGGGSLPLKIPGGYPGSVGFNSNGSVFLDGSKIVLDSDKYEWGRTEKVIGCGYNPSQRKVFFTVDSVLLHEFECKSEEFGTPLYPTLAANSDITVLVNFGQSAFKYLPANLQRTPNPCFIGPLSNSPVLGYDDSKELFSMGRIDSQWLNRSATKNAYNNGTNNKGVDFDDVSEGDLFEIVLDSNSRRSPNTPL
ncbi:hypothetical protein LguiA_006630 [Lonicera macranthoides]